MWQAASDTDYFRVKHTPSGSLAIVDAASGLRLYASKAADGRFSEGVLPPSRVVGTKWRAGLELLASAALAVTVKVG